MSFFELLNEIFEFIRLLWVGFRDLGLRRTLRAIGRAGRITIFIVFASVVLTVALFVATAVGTVACFTLGVITNDNWMILCGGLLGSGGIVAMFIATIPLTILAFLGRGALRAARVALIVLLGRDGGKYAFFSS